MACEIRHDKTTMFTINTDGSGDGELVLPNDSIGVLEMAPNAVNGPAIDDSTCIHIVSVFINPTEAGATDDYINLVDSSIGTTDAAEDEFVVPFGAVAHRLTVSDVTDPGAAGDIWQITVMDDGAATALTCDVDNGETACNDISSEVSIGLFSDMTVLVDSSTGSTDPDASGNMRVAFCLTPN